MAKSVQDRRVYARLTLGVFVIADLGTLLIALYVELTDQIIPSLGFTRPRPGKPPEVTDAKRVGLAVAQVLLRFDDERHWLGAAPEQAGHLFPGCWAKASTTTGSRPRRRRWRPRCRGWPITPPDRSSCCG
jgi:hypothetical protein